MPTPLPDDLVHALEHSRAAVFCHDIVMDAIDLSIALDRHVLLYGLEGLFLLETDTASWRLPPTKAAWVPAGTHVAATTIKEVRCTSLFFEQPFAAGLPDDLVVFNVTPVLREMIKYARRWDAEANRHDPELEPYFTTLLMLCREQIGERGHFSLPKAHSTELKRALEFTRQNLAAPLRIEDVARVAAMSPRTLMRQLSGEIHMSWGQYLLTARMIRAMECLARRMPVTETALEVGYSNMSAFSTAFRKFTQLTPSEYRAQF